VIAQRCAISLDDLLDLSRQSMAGHKDRHLRPDARTSGTRREVHQENPPMRIYIILVGDAIVRQAEPPRDGWPNR
jgi:hypothetical protein